MKFTDLTLADVSTDAKVEALGVVLDKTFAEIENKVSNITKLEGPQGIKGDKGDKGVGIDGIDGRNGVDGKNGTDGKDGKDGKAGKDGISIVDANIAADNSLVFTLSNGNEIDVGNLNLFSSPEVVNYNNTTIRTEDTSVYAVRYDEISAGLAYRGEAVTGNAESSLVWRIQKIEIVDSDVTITWANGSSSFTNAWTDRLSLTYL